MQRPSMMMRNSASALPRCLRKVHGLHAVARASLQSYAAAAKADTAPVTKAIRQERSLFPASQPRLQSRHQASSTPVACQSSSNSKSGLHAHRRPCATGSQHGSVGAANSSSAVTSNSADQPATAAHEHERDGGSLPTLLARTAPSFLHGLLSATALLTIASGFLISAPAHAARPRDSNAGATATEMPSTSSSEPAAQNVRAGFQQKKRSSEQGQQSGLAARVEPFQLKHNNNYTKTSSVFDMVNWWASLRANELQDRDFSIIAATSMFIQDTIEAGIFLPPSEKIKQAVHTCYIGSSSGEVRQARVHAVAALMQHTTRGVR